MTMENARENARTVRRLYEEYINQNKPELLPELVSADYVGPQGERGPDGFGRTIAGVRAGIPDVRFTIEEILAADDGVAIRWTWRGHHTGSLFGLAPSNKVLENTGIAIYRLRGGKVVSASLLTDRLGILQQIGLVSPDIGARRPAQDD